MSSLVKSKILLNKDNCAHSVGGKAVVFNTESAYIYFTNRDYRNYVEGCDYIAIDGAAIALALKLFGVDVVRFHGPDLMSHILAHNHSACKIIAGGLASNGSLVNDYSFNLYFDLPFSNDYSFIAGTLADKILSLDGKCGNRIVLFVSLGLPKQEIVSSLVWTNLNFKNYSRINELLVLPIGAAADFLSGEKKRSGMLWRRFGMEWLPRLIREPRMFPRVVRSFLGIYLFVRQELSLRFIRS